MKSALSIERDRCLAAVVWLTGLPGSGKTTLARLVQQRLWDLGCRTMLLDGDELRQGLCRDLGFTPADRRENIRRAGEVARLFFEQGNIVLCAFVSPFRRDRDWVRGLIDGEFIEVFMRCGVETCRRRDSKRLYARSDAGAVANLTGVGQPYEPPLDPEMAADSERRSPGELAGALLDVLRARVGIGI